MDNALKILALVAEGLQAVRDVVAVFEATVSRAKAINAEGRLITDADLADLRTERNNALDRLKSRIS